MIFSDFDGTLTEKGLLGRTFFDVLELTQKNDYDLVIVSGRSLSWGHFFLTHFPMEFAVMEGGGVILQRHSDSTITQQVLVSDAEIKKLAAVTKKLMEEIPECPLSVDSFGRLTDRAIELKDLKGKTHLVDKIHTFLKENDVHYCASDIHINFWCGSISKYLGVAKLLQTLRPEVNPDNCLFFGDALNDESMFESFKHCVGVSNISAHLKQLKFHPKVILEGEYNRGPYGVLGHLKTYFAK